MRELLIAINVLLMLGFVGIDVLYLIGVIKQFPTILFWENVAYASAYAIFTYLILNGVNVYPWLTLFSAFVAGRVSRSVITPYGFGELAMQHVPLTLLLLLDAILAALLC